MYLQKGLQGIPRPEVREGLIPALWVIFVIFFFFMKPQTAHFLKELYLDKCFEAWAEDGIPGEKWSGCFPVTRDRTDVLPIQPAAGGPGGCMSTWLALLGPPCTQGKRPTGVCRGYLSLTCTQSHEPLETPVSAGPPMGPCLGGTSAPGFLGHGHLNTERSRPRGEGSPWAPGSWAGDVHCRALPWGLRDPEAPSTRPTVLNVASASIENEQEKGILMK